MAHPQKIKKKEKARSREREGKDAEEGAIGSAMVNWKPENQGASLSQDYSLTYWAAEGALERREMHRLLGRQGKKKDHGGEERNRKEGKKKKATAERRRETMSIIILKGVRTTTISRNRK